MSKPYIVIREQPKGSNNYYKYLYANVRENNKHTTECLQYLGKADGPQDKSVSRADLDDDIIQEYDVDVQDIVEGNKAEEDVTKDDIAKSDYTKRHYKPRIKDKHIEEWKKWSKQSKENFLPVTGLMYDGWIERPDYAERAKGAKFEIVEMSPKEYNEISDESFQKYRNGGMFFPDEENVKELQKVYKNEKGRVPMLTLDYINDFDQEGRHRALAAERENIENVPVMALWHTDEEPPNEIKNLVNQN